MGNSVSKDLVIWTNLPDAIFPDKLGRIFSGSAIIDVNNTAGFGKDAIYATVLCNHDPNDRKVLVSWMNNWDYANSVPPINFASANTLPREMKLVDNGKHLVLTNVLVEEVKALRSETKTLNNIEVADTYTIGNLLPNNNGAYEIEMTIKTKSSDFNFKLQNSKGEYLEFRFDIKNKKFSVDRTHSGLVDLRIILHP